MQEINPIVVLIRSSDVNRFQHYTTEIFDVEGFPWRRTVDLDASPLADALPLAAVVVLNHIELSDEEVDQLARHVESGGRLICFRPPVALAVRLGCEPAPPHRHGASVRYQTMADRWMLPGASRAWEHALGDGPIQYHGRADLYTWPADTTSVMAWLAPFAEAPSPHPAVIAGHHGLGKVGLFTYDLPSSVVLAHQGRRAQCSTGPQADADGDGQFKPNDLFVGQLDERLVSVPQADIHQDLLTEILDWVSTDAAPLPRLWHFPDAAPAVAFFNGDSDNMDLSDLRRVLDTVSPHEVPFTTYLMRVHHDDVSPELMQSLIRQGHGFGEHAYAGPHPTPEAMRQQLRLEHDAFAARYGHRPVSYRGHQVIWVGWTDTARYLAENQVRLDTSFAPTRYYREGYLNGSGLPVKFIDESGSLIDLYEQATISTDDGWRTDKCYRPAMSNSECAELSRKQIDAAVDRFHNVYHPYFHPVSTRVDQRDTLSWLASALTYCGQRAIPAVSDRAWVEFNDARRAIRLTSWRMTADDELCFTLRSPTSVTGISVLLPAMRRRRRLAHATIDGEAAGPVEVHWEGRRQIALVTSFRREEDHAFRIRWEGTA